MSDIKSFPFPVLSPDSIDYLDCAYNPAIQPRAKGHDEVTVRHVFEGEGLIGEMLESGQAVFGCMVSLPSTMYRRVFDAEAPCKKEFTQIINYGDSGYGQVTSAVESPMFRPIILTRESVQRVTSVSDKLDPLWENSHIDIPEGSIIAYAGWSRFNGDMGGLLRIEKGDGLSSGQIRVSADTEGGFRFTVEVGEGLFGHLKEPSSGVAFHRSSILTHALSAAFSFLRKEMPDGYEDYINLRAASELLKQEGLGHWGDDDFCPEMAATAMYPHAFPEVFSEDSNGE